MSVAFRAQKKIVAIWSIFSIFLNIAQPAFLALALTPIIAPSSVNAEDVISEPTPEPTLAPSESPVIVEPSAEPTVAPVAIVDPSSDPTPSPTPDATLAPSDSPVPSVLPSATPEPTSNPEIPASPLPSTESSPAPPVVESPTPTPTTSSAPISEPTFKEELQISILDNTIASSIEAVDLTVTETGSAVLATDKLDYAPTDTALITGAGFLPNTGYTLVISSTDEPATSSNQSVTSDENGKIFYAYQLDGTYRPNYKVEALLGSVLVATITFTDSRHITTLTVNGANTTTVSPNGAVATIISIWTDGSSEGNDWESTKYQIEGQPSLCDNAPNITTDSSTTNSSYSLTAPSIAGIYDLTVTAYSDNNCINQSDPITRTNAITVIIPNTAPIITEGASTNVTMSRNSSPTPFSLTLHATDSDTPSQTLTWNISSPAGHGTANVSGDGTSKSISYTPTTNYVGTDSFVVRVSDNHGGTDSITVNLNITNPTGKIELKKVWVGSADSATIKIGTTQNGSQVDSATLSANGTTGENIVNIGTYYLSETMTNSSNYNSSLSCSNDGSNTPHNVIVGDKTGVVDIGSGDDVICTFTNTRKTGRILIDKILFEGPSVQSDWTFTIAGITGTWKDGQIATLNTGSYTITESNNVLGYSLSAVGGACSTISNGNSATLNVLETDATHSNTCSFTNSRDKGSVKVNKQVDKNGDGDYYDYDEQSNHEANDLGFRWSLDGSGTNQMGTTVSNIPTSITGVVTHTVSESVGSDYHFVGWFQNGQSGKSCANPSGTTLPVTVNVTKGSTTEITLCNARNSGTVTIIKHAISHSDQNFRFHTNLPNYDGYFELEDDGNDNNGGTEESTTVKVKTGTYYVSEDTLNGWKLTDLSCNSEGQWGVREDGKSVTFDVLSDQSVVCTFTNTKLGKIEGLKFNDRDADGRKDSGEYGIENWRINLGEAQDQTDHHGEYSFDGLLPGDYEVCEQDQEGWYHIGNTCKTIHLSAGETERVDFGNYQKASVTVKKDVVDANGKAVTDISTSFEFALSSQEGTFNLFDEDGGQTFAVNPGNYSLNETRNDNYDFAGCSIDQHDHDHDHDWNNDDDDKNRHSEDSSDFSFNVKGGDRITITCTNKQRTGDLIVTKYNDINGNGSHDENEPTLDGWEINVSGQESRNTSEGSVTFTDLLADWYGLSETDQEGWTQTSISCNDNQETLTRLSEDVGHSVYVAAGQTTQCEIGNQAKPAFRIQKSNDATGNKNPNDLITYTLVVDLKGSDVDGVQVTDVTPDGFEYVVGSWTADKNGSPLSIAEPNYASPGTWNLGDMTDGDIITLTYRAKINSNQDGGTYGDSAWAEGTSDGWGHVLAEGHDSQYVDGIFVGTNVTINGSTQQTGSVKVERDGEVLGASTELPSTGAETGWLILALTALLTGLFLIFGRIRMQKLSLSALIFIVPLAFGNAPPARAIESENNLSVRVEQPATPSRVNEWKLSFVTLDRNSGTPSVTCYVKKPNSGSFVSFSSVHNSVKPTGDSGNCQVNGSVMSDQGSYEFYVIASTETSSKESLHVSVNYDTSGPGTPNYFSKEHPRSCHWDIKFHTADDAGATVRVEIYSSDQKSFDTNASTRVGSVNIGSNQDGVFTHDREDGCDKEWYYVIRAFDGAGNQSDHRGDEIKGASTIASSSPTSAALVTTYASGSVLGKTDSKVSEDSKGDVLGEENGTKAAESVEGQGLVASAQGVVQKAVKSKSFWWVLITVAAMGIVYGISRKKITK